MSLKKNIISNTLCLSTFVAVFLHPLFISHCHAQKVVGSETGQKPEHSLRGSGLCFTPNKGQLADMNGNLQPDILYKGEGSGADIYLRKTGISYVYSNIGEVLHEVDKQVEELKMTGLITPDNEQEKKQELTQAIKMKIHRVDMDLANCNKNISITNEDELDGYNNYYYAHCPNGILNVKQYNKVTYKNIYNGVDVTYYGNKEHGIKYDLIVQPHADPKQIKLQWKGATELKLVDGKLKIKTSINEFYESMPKVYQNINGKIVDIKAEYSLESKILSTESNKTSDLGPPTSDSYFITFKLSNYQIDFPLIIDPWATYYGGNKTDYGSGIATDTQGNVVITGWTAGGTFPANDNGQGGNTTWQGTFGGGTYDAFIVKFDPTGKRLWATYYGGNQDDYGYDGNSLGYGGISTDSQNNVIITGKTKGGTFPANNNGLGGNTTWQGAFAGGTSDAFVVKLDPTGKRLWATYYGGDQIDGGYSIATDKQDNVVITGYTEGGTFPANNNGLAGNVTWQSAFGGIKDAFVVKFDSNGNRLWATYFGGDQLEYCYGIATDTQNNVLITGFTAGGTFPANNNGLSGNVTWQSVFGGSADAFVVKFDNKGDRLWASYYGGTDRDESHGITTDTQNNVVITGYTYGGTFPANNNGSGGNVTWQGTFGGGNDAFIVKFDSKGNRLWATFYGGNTPEWAYKVATDLDDNIYILMEGEDVPVPAIADACSYQPVFNGGIYVAQQGRGIEDQLVVKFSPTGTKKCATYIGGAGEDDIDWGGGITIRGNILYITGSTEGAFPVTADAFQTLYGGPSAGFYTGGSDAYVISLCTNICEGKSSLGLNVSSPTSICTNIPVNFTPTISASCDTKDYKYSWTFAGGNPATSSSLQPPSVTYTSPGFYNVKFVVSTICKVDSVIKSVVINPCLINISVTNSTICSGNCTTITATGSAGIPPYTYSWNTGATTSSINVCPTATSDYSVIVTDANGNFAGTISRINVETVTGLVSTNDIWCQQRGGATATIFSGASPYIYSWSNGYTTGPTLQVYSSITNLASGSYSVTVIDNNGCTFSQPFTIPVSGYVSASFTYPPVCVGSSVTFKSTGTTGQTDNWEIGSPVNVTGTTQDFTYTFLTAGTYSVTHSVSTASCSNTVTEYIIVTNCIGGPSVITSNTSICIGTCAVITSSSTGGSSPYTYSWNTGATTQNINPCPVSTTTYTVTIRDAGGNTSTSTALVTINPTVSVTTTPTNINCNGGTGSATATGISGTPGYIYTWSNLVSGSQVSGLSAGTYTVTITDAKGCTATSATTIISPPPLSGQFTKGTANCSGCGCKEWIMVNATGGTSPYSYTWSASGGYVNRYRNNLCPGAYNVNVKDKNGCSINVNLTAP